MDGWGLWEGGFRVGLTLTGDNRLAILPPTHTCQAGWGRETDPLSCLPSQASTNELSGLWEAAFPPQAVPEAVPSPTAPHYLLGVLAGSGCPPYLLLCLPAAVRRRLWAPKCVLSAPGSLHPQGWGDKGSQLPAVQLGSGSEQRALIPPVGPTSMPMRGAGVGCVPPAPRRAGTKHRRTPGMGSWLHSQSPCGQSPAWPGEGLTTGAGRGAPECVERTALEDGGGE